MPSDKKYFCTEPWTGVLSLTIELDAVFCPCYLKMKIGNLGEKSLAELWNSDSLVALRTSFAKGELPVYTTWREDYQHLHSFADLMWKRTS